MEHLSGRDEVRVEGALRFSSWRDGTGRRRSEFSIVGVARPLSEGGAFQGARTTLPVRSPTEPERRQLIRARARLRRSMPRSTFRLWVKPLRLDGVDAGAVHLVAPLLIRAWAERRYSSLMVDALRKEGLPGRVRFGAAEIVDRDEASSVLFPVRSGAGSRDRQRGQDVRTSLP
jgi:hypothetical protein